jgi:hypothetical protein
VLTLFVPMLYQQSAPKGQQSNSKALLWGVVFAAATLTTFSPWLIRNALWTGNPIYPLHNSLFQKPRNPIANQQAASPVNNADTLQEENTPGGNAFIARRMLYNETWWQALLLPFRFFYEGRDDNPQFFDGKLSPFLLLLPFLAFFFKPPNDQRQREQRHLLFFASLYFFLTFFQQVMRIRYIVPVIPPLVILSMYGLHETVTSLAERLTSKIIQKTAAFLLVACISGCMLWYNLHYIASQFALVHPLPYQWGKVSREDYITNFRPEYPAIQYANSILPPEAKVLCLFLGNRGYYMDFQPVFEQPYSSGIFAQFLASEDQKQTITAILEQKNITHVLMREDLTAKWLQQLNDKDQLRIAPFFANSSKPLLRQDGYIFFQVTNAVNSQKTL